MERMYRIEACCRRREGKRSVRRLKSRSLGSIVFFDARVLCRYGVVLTCIFAGRAADSPEKVGCMHT